MSAGNGRTRTIKTSALTPAVEAAVARAVQAIATELGDRR